MRQTFVDYLRTIDLTTDPLSKIQIALTQLRSSQASIYFTPERTLEAIECDIIIRINNFGPFQQVNGTYKTFDSTNELIFSPATLLFKIDENVLTIGNFLEGTTQYCFAAKDIFDGGYVNKLFQINLYGSNVFVDFELKAPVSITKHVDRAISGRPVPINDARKQAVVAHFEEARTSQNLGEKATYQEIYDMMGSPTKQQLWDTLREKDNVNFHKTGSDRALEPLASIAKELSFRFKGGRPTGNKK